MPNINDPEIERVVRKYWLTWYRASCTSSQEDIDFMQAVGVDIFTAVHVCLRANSTFSSAIRKQLIEDQEESTCQ